MEMTVRIDFLQALGSGEIDLRVVEITAAIYYRPGEHDSVDLYGTPLGSTVFDVVWEFGQLSCAEQISIAVPPNQQFDYILLYIAATQVILGNVQLDAVYRTSTGAAILGLANGLLLTL